MAILSNLFGGTLSKHAQAAANKLIVENLKKGKTKEQCRCIDFLYSDDSESGKKKGCLSFNNSMTMDEYYKYVDNIVAGLNLRERAIEKIGLDESMISEIPPINLSSFVRRGDDVKTKWEETKVNGYYRMASNKYWVAWIFFSATQIYTYTYFIDTTCDSTVEITRDFFYKDITCIRTEHEVEARIIERKEGCGCLRKKESKYYHDDQHYDTLQITVPNDSYSFCCRSGSINESIQQSIMAAKAMIREKKG